MRVGRPSAKDETWLAATIEGIFDANQLLRFKDLERATKIRGISKPTLWHHLRELTDKGIVVHEGKWYRKNPLLKQRITLDDAYPVNMEWESNQEEEFVTRASLFTVGQGDGAQLGEYVRLHKLEQDRKMPYDRFLSERVGKKLLDFKTIWEETGREEQWTPVDFQNSLAAYFQPILLSTLNLLYAVWRTEDSAMACEIARLRFELDVMLWFAKLARETWVHRKQISMSDLHNLELKYSIEHLLSAQVQSCRYYKQRHFHSRIKGKEWCPKAMKVIG